MSKRICMVAYTHYRSDARPRREAEALAERGDHVDFVALAKEDAKSVETKNGVTIIDLPTRRYRGQSLRGYLSSYGEFFARATAEITRRHLKERYDVIYAHTMPDFIVFSAGLAKALGAKVVLDLHDTMPELYQSKFGKDETHPLIRGIALQEQASCAFADALVCVHEPHKELLVSRGVSPSKVTALLNIPDPRIFGGRTLEARPVGDAPKLVYHGTIAERLGLDVALAAFKSLLPEHPSAQFHIIGTGDFAERVTQEIARLDLSKNVRFDNQHFAIEKVPELVRDASVGVVPNRDDPATRLMLPVKLLEYVYLGIPAVAPRLPVIQHYFGEDAVAYYDPGDVQSLASAMRRVLTSETTRATLAQNAGRFAERYQWSSMKHDLYRVIDSA